MNIKQKNVNSYNKKIGIANIIWLKTSGGDINDPIINEINIIYFRFLKKDNLIILFKNKLIIINGIEIKVIHKKLY